MCRSIQQLRGAEPPATDAEVRDAARQYVRKISGYPRPSAANVEVVERAIDEVAAATSRLLADLVVGPGSRPPTLVQRRERSERPAAPDAAAPRRDDAADDAVTPR